MSDLVAAFGERIGDALDPDRRAALVAGYVRLALEDFHADNAGNKVAGLDDDAMARLNPAIRRAVFEILGAIDEYVVTKGDPADGFDPRRAGVLLLTAAINAKDYWEPASELPPITRLD